LDIADIGETTTLDVGHLSKVKDWFREYEKFFYTNSITGKYSVRILFAM